MRVNVPIFFLSILVSVTATGCGPQQVSFSKDVKPILDARCMDCHDGSGEGSEKTDFNTTDYANVMKGTKFGPVVIAGDSISSTLYRVINHMADPKIHMPPHDKRALAKGRADPLQGSEIEIIKAWIDQGAKNN